MAALVQKGKCIGKTKLDYGVLFVLWDKLNKYSSAVVFNRGYAKTS